MGELGPNNNGTIMFIVLCSNQYDDVSLIEFTADKTTYNNLIITY